jgi:hypothetical protein
MNMSCHSNRNKLVILNAYPMGRVLFESLGLDHFRKAGFDVICVDMARCFLSDIHERYQPANKDYVVREGYFIECSTKDDVEHVIKENAEKAIFYPLYFKFNQGLDKMWVARLLKKHGCEYVLQDFFPQPSGPVYDMPTISYFLKRVIDGIKSAGPIGLFKKIAGQASFYMMRRNVFYQRPTRCFVAGRRSYDKFKAMYPSADVVSVPGYDFYKWNEMLVRVAKEGRNSDIPEPGYVLYIDQAIYDAPDIRISGRKLVDKGVFFAKINSFFDRIEKALNKKVVIAASPKYAYSGDEFCGRTIVAGKTPEAVHFSDIVVMHTTTAVNYAIIDKKPLVFLMFDEFDSQVRQELATLASSIKRNLMHVDACFDKEDLVSAIKIDESAYESFICDYLATSLCSRAPAALMAENLTNV